MVRTGVVLVAMALLVAGTRGQQRLKFEVASARVVLDWSDNVPRPLSELPRFSNLVTDQRLHLVQPLRSLLLRALRVNDDELVAPDWTNGWWVEVRATVPPGTTEQQVPEMLHALLIERFGLVTHSEARTMDAYQLVVGATGIKMREVEAVNDLDRKFDDALVTTGGVVDRTTQTPDGPVRTMNVPGAVRRITSRTMYERTIGGGSAGKTITATRMTMAELVPLLRQNLGERVIDRTGLTGIYQFTIQLPRDEADREPLRALLASSGRPSTSADWEPETATTLKAVEGLGLKLERRRMPVDVVVVGSIQRHPTEN